MQNQVGQQIQKQMSYRFIQQAFPAWFRKTEQRSSRSTEGGNRATTQQWEYRMRQALESYANYLYEVGRVEDAELFQKRLPWTYIECTHIGSLVLTCVVEILEHFITEVKTVRSINNKPKTVSEYVLTDYGKQQKEGIRKYMSQFAHDVLPMLIEPLLVTNDNGGGWMADALQKQTREAHR